MTSELLNTMIHNELKNHLNEVPYLLWFSNTIFEFSNDSTNQNAVKVLAKNEFVSNTQKFALSVEIETAIENVLKHKPSIKYSFFE